MHLAICLSNLCTRCEARRDDLDAMMYRGQAYDNASTMSGIHSEEQRSIKEINSKAISVFVAITRSILRAFMQWGLLNSLISFHSYFTKCDFISSLSFYCMSCFAEMITRVGARGVPGGPTAPQNFAWPPQNFLGLFLKVLHRPLTAPLVAKLAPPVAPK